MWRRALWILSLIVLIVTTVRELQDPEALRFHAVTLVVLSVVAAVGSVAAIVLVAVRRLLSRGDNQPPSLGQIR